MVLLLSAWEKYEQLYAAKDGQILYDTSLVAVVLSDSDGEKIHHTRYSCFNRGLIAVAAQTWIDASGDAVLSRAAGVPVAAGDRMALIRFAVCVLLWAVLMLSAIGIMCFRLMTTSHH